MIKSYLEIKTLTISWKGDKWLVSFSCWVEPQPAIKTNREIGLDRGVKKLFATSEGWKYINPKYFQKGEEQLIKLQLVNKFDLIAYEDLKAKEMTERKPNQKRKANRYLVKSIIRASWNQLAQFISYKVEEAGKETILVNPRNATQRCSQCGKLANPKIERDIVIYNCSCGLVASKISYISPRTSV